MRTPTLVNLEREFRPLLTRLHPWMAVQAYSRGRNIFLGKLKEEMPSEAYEPPKELSRELWGIKFRSPVMNAAGMFKNGECYGLCAIQGAGAYLGGTGTWNPRTGNSKLRINLPFIPYYESGAASNWLGLPNKGDLTNAEQVGRMARVNDTPIGWSVMGSPDFDGPKKLEFLVSSLRMYADQGADFLEMNESCPNTSHGKPQEDKLAERLGYVSREFLQKRQRNVPVIVKFSVDTPVEQVRPLMDLLFDLGFGGVNFGNTSTNYSVMREKISPGERRLFDFFTSRFGGGVSGKPLKEASLELCAVAAEHVRRGGPKQKFHVIRTGGVSSLSDIRDSERAGVPLNQWFTGYFENLALHGHDVYRNLYASSRALK